MHLRRLRPEPGPTPPPAPTPPPPPTTPPTPPAPGSSAWYKLPISRSIFMGVGAVDGNTAFFPYGDNGSGAGVLKTTDGGATFTECNTTTKTPTLILLGAAAQSEKSAVVTGVLPALHARRLQVQRRIGPSS